MHKNKPNHFRKNAEICKKKKMYDSTTVNYVFGMKQFYIICSDHLPTNPPSIFRNNTKSKVGCDVI